MIFSVQEVIVDLKYLTASWKTCVFDLCVSCQLVWTVAE